MADSAIIDFRTEPSRYKHWKLALESGVAYLTMDVNEEGGLKPGYKLKLNSYDLGVDIELADVVQRLRFEHPEIGAVVIRSQRDRVFCSGANINMLGLSTHDHKVNFCKFTNETRMRPTTPTRATSARSTASPRAAATNSRWPATRSCWPTTVRARCRCPNCRCSPCCPAPAV